MYVDGMDTIPLEATLSYFLILQLETISQKHKFVRQDSC
jgi:hypothetical protein